MANNEVPPPPRRGGTISKPLSDEDRNAYARVNSYIEYGGPWHCSNCGQPEGIYHRSHHLECTRPCQCCGNRHKGDVCWRMRRNLDFFSREWFKEHWGLEGHFPWEPEGIFRYEAIAAQFPLSQHEPPLQSTGSVFNQHQGVQRTERSRPHHHVRPYERPAAHVAAQPTTQPIFQVPAAPPGLPPGAVWYLVPQAGAPAGEAPTPLTQAQPAAVPTRSAAERSDATDTTKIRDLEATIRDLEARLATSGRTRRVDDNAFVESGRRIQELEGRLATSEHAHKEIERKLQTSEQALAAERQLRNQAVLLLQQDQASPMEGDVELDQEMREDNGND